MPLLLKPTDFPSNDEIENASYEDEEITVTLPEKVDDDGAVVREATEITRTMCIARFDGGHAIVRRISSNAGGEAEYRRLEDAKLELIACEGKTPKIHAVFHRNELSQFQMFTPRNSEFHELHGGKSTVGCQNAVLALHGVDMTGVGQGVFAHQGDHIDVNVRINFPWNLRRIAAFLNSVRTGSFEGGVHNDRNKDRFQMPMRAIVRDLLEENEFDTYASLPEPYKLLGIYLHYTGPMAGFYTSPMRHQHDDIKFLKRAVGRAALRFIHEYTDEKNAFKEARVSTDPSAPITRDILPEMLRTWDPPTPTPMPATAVELIERIRSGNYSKPAPAPEPESKSDSAAESPPPPPPPPPSLTALTPPERLVKRVTEKKTVTDTVTETYAQPCFAPRVSRVDSDGRRRSKRIRTQAPVDYRDLSQDELDEKHG